MILVGKLLEGDMDKLPDLEEAESIMKKYRLDEDAKSKLAEIMRCRIADSERALNQVRKQLEGSANASAMLCKVAMTLIDGGNLKDPPERRPGNYAPDSSKGGKGKSKGGDKDRDRDDEDKKDKDRD